MTDGNENETLPAHVVALFEEAGRTAGDRTADAIAALVGRPLKSATIVESSGDAPKAAEETTYAALFQVQGAGGAEFLSVFGASSMRTVRDLLAPGMDDDSMPLDAVALEVGNICASHFLGAIGDLLDAPLLPSPPTITTHTDLVAAAQEPPIVFHTEIRTEDGTAFHAILRFRPAGPILQALERVAAA